MDQLVQLQQRLDTLAAAFERLERRVNDLEAAHEVSDASRVTAPTVTHVTDARDEMETRSLLDLGLIGRTLIILGGAFLLRAFTDSGGVPLPIGLSLGITYALIWIFMADRAGRADRVSSSDYYGIAAAMIAYPLIWEATKKFDFFSPISAAIILAAVSGLLLGIGWIREQKVLAWVATIFALLTSLALIVDTRSVVPFGWALLVVGLISAWIAYDIRWHALRWPVAAVIDMLLINLGFLVVAGFVGQAPVAAMILQISTMFGFIGTFTVRALWRERAITAFEIMQSSVAWLAGFGGALWISNVLHVGQLPVAVVGVVLALTAYIIGYRIVDRTRLLHNTFYFTILGLAFTVPSTAVLMGTTPASILWAAIALVTGILAIRYQRVELVAQTVGYLFAAALGSGLLTFGALGLFGSSNSVGAGQLGLSGLLAMVIAAICAVSHLPRLVPESRRTHFPRALALAIAVWGIGGLVTTGLMTVVGGPSGATPAGVSATQTVVLCIAAVVLAWVSRIERLRAASTLVPLLLIVIALKLVVQDLHAGRPATLFIGFAFYGAALIIAPRLRVKREREEEAPPEAGVVEEAATRDEPKIALPR
ncbi:MAG: hypothetical protein WBX15_04970 [Thermoanaerobaculia bacterium]